MIWNITGFINMNYKSVRYFLVWSHAARNQYKPDKKRADKSEGKNYPVIHNAGILVVNFFKNTLTIYVQYAGRMKPG